MPESLQDGNVGSEMQEKADALNEFADALESAASDSEITDWDNSADEPETMDDHTDECAINASEEAPGAVDDCDCGFAEKQSAHEEWENERDDKIQRAVDAAQAALDELSI